MSVRKLTAKLLAALAVFAGGASVSAQEHALADPFAFDPDFQWFEPIYDADILDAKPKKRAHTGWFGTYDKLHLWGKRPESEPTTIGADSSEYQLDFGDGHRYEFGYMKPGDDTGWLFGWSDLDVNAGEYTRMERINRLNDEQFDDGGPEFPAPPFGQNALTEDDNNFGYSTRFYDVGRSTNNVEYDSYEINKTWRMEPYHYGGILEPMIGVRFVTLDDMAITRRYARTREDGENVVPPQVLSQNPYFTDLGINDDSFEQLTQDFAEVENEAYTLQLGFRYFKFVNRFRYSAEFRAFSGLNLQHAMRYTRVDSTFYDGFDVGADVTSFYRTENKIEHYRTDEFFIGYDVRAELGYQLTNMIHVRGGFQIFDLAKGLGRAGHEADGDPILGSNDQNFLAVGGTFGIELNR
ncbi:hypothetical protein LOC71_01585 [Rhodopirellula sp. JC740]|uniref:Uncharacterized protein n=1 Tax=Rhodopirellula halodulae TaxID=2894198 RepID=A0ABS8NBK9_9BACT|nr:MULTISPECIES: hypothetical protein [unclassified Rhodopirellula]MCC9640947.1 hypothetical protein [Rhodopirellula sp. JC740]MCC9656446.1 hypothetical protein [Rhodopirellula sp. JC737]